MNEHIQKWIRVYLKCYINLILYKRNVYPAASFDLTTYQGFNLPQYMPINRHSQLQEYIETLISDILSKLVHIYRVSICIINKEDEYCLEKFTLDFGEFQHTDNIETLSETQVFNEFRSSLNSLMLKLEGLKSIKDDKVTFDVVVNVVDLDMGRTAHNMSAISNEQEKAVFDRDTNWTSFKEDENLPTRAAVEGTKPKIRMSSLLGCDVGPLVIYTYFEELVLSSQTHQSLYTDSSSSSLDILSTL